MSKLYICILPLLFSAYSNGLGPLDAYNNQLILLEAKLHVCADAESEQITGIRELGITEKEFRTGLSYYYIRNAFECFKLEREKALDSARSVVSSNAISSFLKANAQELISSYSSDQENLNEALKAFNSLDASARKQLESLSIVRRVFSPSKANTYYFD